MITCVVCEEKLSCINQMKLHLKFHHSEFAGKYHCKEIRCFRSFETWSQYRRHLLQVHNCGVSSPIIKTSESASSIVHIPEPDVVALEENMDNFPACSHDDVQPIVSISDCEQAVEKRLLSFAGNLYSNLKMPRSFVQDMFETVTELLKFILFDIIKPLIEQNLMNSEMTLSLTDIFNIVLEPLELQFATEYRRFKSFQKTGFFYQRSRLCYRRQIKKCSSSRQNHSRPSCRKSSICAYA